MISNSEELLPLYPVWAQAAMGSYRHMDQQATVQGSANEKHHTQFSRTVPNELSSRPLPSRPRGEKHGGDGMIARGCQFFHPALAGVFLAWSESLPRPISIALIDTGHGRGGVLVTDGEIPHGAW